MTWGLDQVAQDGGNLKITHAYNETGQLIFDDAACP
jgi:hypothetical protein